MPSIQTAAKNEMVNHQKHVLKRFVTSAKFSSYSDEELEMYLKMMNLKINYDDVENIMFDDVMHDYFLDIV